MDAITAEPPRFRIMNLVMHASDPVRLEFAARVKLRDPIKAGQLPERPIIWETWGGFGFEKMEASIEADLVLMKGNIRPLFAREHVGIATLAVFGMLGVRIFI